MRLPYDIIIFDLEANQPSDKIIEIGAVKFLRDGGIHPEKFSTLVKIDETLGVCNGGKIVDGENQGKTITELTGITDEMLSSAPEFPEAAEKFEKWAFSGSKNFILAAWGNWDVPCLRAEYERFQRPYPFRGKSFDIKSMVVWSSCMFGKKWKSDGMGSMLKCWELPFEGSQHRAKDDAFMTARLLQKVWKFYEENGEKIIKNLKQLGIK